MSLFVMLFSGAFGFAYFLYGKKMQDYIFLISGIVLMVYPYFTKGVVSLILCIIFILLPFIIKKIL